MHSNFFALYIDRARINIAITLETSTMYSINAKLTRWTELQTWLNEQNLVQGQDYTVTDSVPGWTMVNFQRESDLTAFAQYGSTLNFD